MIMASIGALAIQASNSFANQPYTLNVKVPRGNLVATSATTEKFATIAARNKSKGLRRNH